VRVSRASGGRPARTLTEPAGENPIPLISTKRISCNLMSSFVKSDDILSDIREIIKNSCESASGGKCGSDTKKLADQI